MLPEPQLGLPVGWGFFVDSSQEVVGPLPPPEPPPEPPPAEEVVPLPPPPPPQAEEVVDPCPHVSVTVTVAVHLQLFYGKLSVENTEKIVRDGFTLRTATAFTATAPANREISEICILKK